MSSYIEYCEENNINYAIRAVKSRAVKAIIENLREHDWQCFIDKEGEEVDEQQTYRTSHCIGNYEKAFSLVIQRSKNRVNHRWI